MSISILDVTTHSFTSFSWQTMMEMFPNVDMGDGVHPGNVRDLRVKFQDESSPLELI